MTLECSVTGPEDLNMCAYPHSTYIDVLMILNVFDEPIRQSDFDAILYHGQSERSYIELILKAECETINVVWVKGFDTGNIACR